MERKELKEKLDAIFSNNKYYFSSYTGTPMFMSDKAMPAILKVIDRYAGKINSRNKQK